MTCPRYHGFALAVVLACVTASSTRASTWTDALVGAKIPASLATWRTTAGQTAPGEGVGAPEKIVTAGPAGAVLDSTTTVAGSYELHARVRLRTNTAPTAWAVFRIGRQNDADPGTALHVGLQSKSDIVIAQVLEQGKPLHDLTALSNNLNWSSPYSNRFVYYLRAYPTIAPGWPEDFRAHVEHDMAELPGHDDKWLDIRMEVRPGQISAWLDDRLVAQKSDQSRGSIGTARIELSAGAQLVDYRITALPAISPAFLPVRLGGYANGRRFARGAAIAPESLPQPDSAVEIAGVPFVFPGINPEGNDHLDISRSLYRQANLEGYFPSNEQSWGGSTYRDPARIQLRLPQGSYDCLYLIAAAEPKADTVPLLTAMFYRPTSGFSESFEGRVPLTNAVSTQAVRLPVTQSDGAHSNLWLVKIPLDPARLTAFSDLDIVEVELTKQVLQFRAYPDPVLYGWHQGGLPSSVHIYAATLGLAPVNLEWTPANFGHVWTAPAIPSYTATLVNRGTTAQAGSLVVTTCSYDGTESTRQRHAFVVGPGATLQVPCQLPVKLNGYHEVAAKMQIAGKTWTEKRSFVRLAPDNRATRWTAGKGALFGYWSYHGGHYSPKADATINLMTAAGARTSSTTTPSLSNAAAVKHWTRVLSSGSAWATAPASWSSDDTFDRAKYSAYRDSLIAAITRYQENAPEQFRPDTFPIFPEPNIGPRFTDGNYPEYWGEPSDPFSPQEKLRLRTYMNSATVAAEALREKWPNSKLLVPWGDPLFVVPLLRAGFPKHLIDGSALDLCGFERLPEQQLHQVSLHRLYTLRKEYEKAGIPDPLLAFSEGIFVPTEVGACSWREQMDIYNRWTLISMAYGVKHFYSGWFAFDLADAYGSEHYGGCGIQRRIPYCDPKPAYAAYATMTDRLDQADYEGWMKTGSHSTYCLRFKGPRGAIYTLWTLRGARPVTITLKSDGEVKVTDTMNNTRVYQSRGRQVAVRTDASVIYVTTTQSVEGVQVGNPDHSDARPAPGARTVADLGDGTWRYTGQRDLIYETNNFDTDRDPGHFAHAVATEPGRGRVLTSALQKQDRVRELMPWYNMLAPRQPVSIKGAPVAIGLWVKGASDWGRVVYALRDAKGERWISVGTKDQWNCDDMHSWSSFNFDGWRYLRFELPGHAGYDNFRKHGTTWWRSEGGDGVVDLPLQVDNLIVEQRTHILYVNDVQPVAGDTVRFGKLMVEYAAPFDATEAAVRLSRLRMPMPADNAALPNPIAEMARNGVDAPAGITKLEPPAEHNDGTGVHIYFDAVAGAKSHFIWCSPHADGRGAVNLTPGGAKSGQLIGGLRPGVRFSFWLVYSDANDKLSKPSIVAQTTLIDQFKEK